MCYELLPTDCLSVFDHFVGWHLKGSHSLSDTENAKQMISHIMEKMLLSLHELIELQTFENKLELDKKLDLLISITKEEELKPDFFYEWFP